MRRIAALTALSLVIGSLGACDRRQEIPQASSPAACKAIELGDASDLAKRDDLPVDRVATIEGMPHPLYFGWNQDGHKRAVSKLLGTERRLLLFQQFDGETPPTVTEMTGLLRRYRDLPANPWEAVRKNVKTQFNWEIPEDAYILMEGMQPEGCQ